MGKTIYILIGAKGSGKSYIGRLLERTTSVRFLSVEAIVLENLKSSKLTGFELEKQGFRLEEEALENLLQHHDEVAFEATGTSDYFPTVLKRLGSKYTLRLIHIQCPLDTCLDRIRVRDQSNHIPVSEEQISTINQKAEKLRLNWDLEIDNTGPMPDHVILSLFSKLRSV